MSVYESVVDVLTPLVGRPAAEICIRSSAIKMGRASSDLVPGDMPVLVEVVRSSLRDLMEGDLLEKAVREMRACHRV